MAVIPAGEEPDLEYHRLQPVASDIKARTEAERLESLRKAACYVGGDAVIEAVNEEVRNENAQYVLVSSGTAVIWVRPKTGEVKPLTTHRKPKKEAASEPATQATAEPDPPPATATATPPAPTATATAAPVASAAPAATATPTAAPAASPAKTSKLPTNAAPKPIGKQTKPQ